MPVLTVTDYILTGAGKAGLYVQFRDNRNPTIVFTSATPTDGNGQFSMAGSPPPPADYSAYTSPLLGVGAVWTLYDPHFRVAYTRGDDAVLNSVTVAAAPADPTAPYAALLADGVTATPAGAVFGKVLDWGGMAYNYKAYGCKLDGVTDDTTKAQAVHAAVIAAGGGEIDHPGGVLRITGALTAQMAAASQGITFRGVGRGVSVISQATVNTDCLVLGATNAEVGDYMRLSGMSLKCAVSVNATGKCLRLNNCLHGVFESFEVSGGGYGIYLEGQNEQHHIRDVNFGNHSVNAFSMGNLNGGGAGGPLNLPAIQKCKFEHWRIGSSNNNGGANAGGPAIVLTAGSLGGSQTSLNFTLERITIEGWIHHQISLGSVNAFEISHFENEVVSGLPDNTYSVIINTGAQNGSGVFRNCLLAVRDNGGVNRFANGIYGGGQSLYENILFSGAGAAVADFNFTGAIGGLVMNSTLSNGGLVVIGGSSSQYLMFINLRLSNGRPTTVDSANNHIPGAIANDPNALGFRFSSDLMGFYAAEANTRWWLSRGGVGLNFPNSALVFGMPGNPVSAGIGIISGPSLGVAGRLALSDVATTQAPAAASAGLFSTTSVPTTQGINGDGAFSPTRGKWYFKQGTTWYDSRIVQLPSEAVLVSGVDASLGDAIQVTLTAARLVGAPGNLIPGQIITLTFIQGGAGAFAVTWNAIFKGLTWSNAGNAAGTRSTIPFWYDGVNLNQLGAQTPYAV